MYDDYDPIDLKIISAIYSEGTLSDVARKMNKSKSAISMRIDRMEKRAGTQLVIMSNPLQLTSAGQLALEFAREFFAASEKYTTAINRLFKHESLIVAANSALVIDDILPLLNRLSIDFPKTKIKLIELDDHQIIAGVLERKAHIGLVSQIRQNEALSFEPYRTANIFVLCSKEHPYANRTSLRFNECIEFDLIGYDPATIMSPAMMGGMIKTDVIKDTPVELDTLESAAHLCLRSDKLLCLTLDVIAERFCRLHGAVIIRLNEPWNKINLSLVTRSIEEKRPPAMHKFISLLKAAYRDKT